MEIKRYIAYILLKVLRKTTYILLIITYHQTLAQTWTLWASGLPAGVYPKLAIAPNHDIFYGLTATGGTKGLIYKANTLTAQGSFAVMPVIPLPSSTVNNIQILITNTDGEPVVGIFRNTTTDPVFFKYNNTTNGWAASSVDFPPNLGAFAAAISPNGTIWIGTKWSYIYKSTNKGLNFTRIDETPIVKNVYPCYYPTYGGNPSDGAIYSINVDKNGRVYAGTEGAGVIYSDDEGISWHPADFHACLANDSSQKDTASPMQPLSNTGNLGAIGFTANNNVIFNGTNMWAYSWNNCIGFADMTNHSVSQAVGFPQYLITAGLQVTKIVTTDNGKIFLHTGTNASSTSGIYTSTDGIHWTVFNTGITSGNTSQAQGSLAVDGDKVYMATPDGKVWVFDASSGCGSSLNLTQADNLNNGIPATPIYKRATQTITANNIIGAQNAAASKYFAGKTILLNPKFEVAYGSYFVGDIKLNPCNDN